MLLTEVVGAGVPSAKGGAGLGLHQQNAGASASAAEGEGTSFEEGAQRRFRAFLLLSFIL